MSIFFKILIVVFVFALFDLVFTLVRKPPQSGSVRIFFGLPGSGKTTFASWIVRKDLKKGLPVWSNVPIIGAYRFNVKEDLAKFNIEDGRLIVDEAGIDYNNRQFSSKKGMSQEQIEWWKLVRHYGIQADLFSQSYNDCDVTLRRLASDLYLVTKSLFPYCVTVRKIKRKIGIDDLQHVPVDMYYMGLPILDTDRCVSPLTWKMFNSYDRPSLPPKDWLKYEETTTKYSTQ